MLSALLVAFGTVFVAEMADKTQLASIALATRYRLVAMLAGLAIGSAAVMGISSAIGAAAGSALPTEAIGIGAGVVFVAVGVWMLVGALRNRSEDADDMEDGGVDGGEQLSAIAEESGRRSGFGPVMIVAGTFIAAELGDKTMLAAITLASRGNALMVWAGGAAALFVVDAIAAALGDVLSRYLAPKVIAPIAGALFVAAGVWMLLDALVG